MLNYLRERLTNTTDSDNDLGPFLLAAIIAFGIAVVCGLIVLQHCIYSSECL
jgi:hypothetical protein